MAARLRTLERLPAVRVLLWVLADAAVEAAIVQHVQADEVRHLVVHALALAQLKGQVLVVLVGRCLLVSADQLEVQVCRVVEHVRADRQEAELPASVHDVAGVVWLRLDAAMLDLDRF